MVSFSGKSAILMKRTEGSRGNHIVHNPKVKEWCRLHQKKAPRPRGPVLIEGMHLVEERIAPGSSSALHLEGSASSPFDLPLCTLSERSCASSRTVYPAAASPRCMPCRLNAHPPIRIILLDRIQDPGNVAPSCAPRMRSALTMSSCLPAARTSIMKKSSAPPRGAVPMNCVRRSLREAMDEARKQDVRIYATALHHDAIPLSQACAFRFALIFGNEDKAWRKR